MTMRSKATLGLTAIIALAIGLYAGFLYGKENRIRTHEALNAVLWMQTSEEYKMSAVQAFRLAEVMVERALADPDWTAIPEQKNARDLQKTAVILDLDETVLDNSRFQGQIVLDNGQFEYSKLLQWEKTGRPTLIPDALHFIRRLQELNIDVFYITNRSYANRDATIELLKGLGLPVDADGANLLSRDTPPTKGSDKHSRREIVMKMHRVLLQVGDNLADFVSGGIIGKNATLESRAKTAEAHRNFWGTKWIIVSNPIYGSWEHVLYGFNNRWTREQKLKAKYTFVKGDKSP